MVTKILKIIGILILLITLTGCPGDEDCNDLGSSTRVDNLITLTPVQPTYNQGDIITLKSEIPASNYYFGDSINLFEKTNDYYALLITSSQLFFDNELLFIKGNQGSETNWFDATYNPENAKYELEIQIKLNRPGNYSFITNDSFYFQGSSECNRYRLDTNIVNNEPGPGVIEFTVQ